MMQVNDIGFEDIIKIEQVNYTKYNTYGCVIKELIIIKSEFFNRI